MPKQPSAVKRYAWHIAIVPMGNAQELKLSRGHDMRKCCEGAIKPKLVVHGQLHAQQRHHLKVLRRKVALEIHRPKLIL